MLTKAINIIVKPGCYHPIFQVKNILFKNNYMNHYIPENVLYKSIVKYPLI